MSSAESSTMQIIGVCLFILTFIITRGIKLVTARFEREAQLRGLYNDEDAFEILGVPSSIRIPKDKCPASSDAMKKNGDFQQCPSSDEFEDNTSIETPETFKTPDTLQLSPSNSNSSESLEMV